MKSYIKTDAGVSMFIDGQVLSVEDTHPKFNAILDAIRENQWDDIPGLVNIASSVETYAMGTAIEVDAYAGVIRYNGMELRNYTVDHILKMMREGFDIDPMVTYLTNLMANPSKRAVEELHKFNEYGKMPITDDGCFIAYKIISGWYDTYTRTVFNKPYELFEGEDFNKVPYTTDKGVTVEIEDGLTTVSMPRNFVDDDAERTCSEGLHFCSHEYLKSFSGDRIVVLKINPADVVSIPVDYNNTKGRCWKYQVIDVLSSEEFRKAMETNIFTESVYVTTPADDSLNEDDWEEVDAHDDDAEAFESGYLVGYRDGRNSEYNDPMGSSPWASGYDEGYGDGKRHKAKRFK
jgi:hypothetical protein